MEEENAALRAALGTNSGICQAEQGGALRTAQEIMDQTNQLARELYRLRGYVRPEGYRFDEATHPHEVQAWQGACAAQLLLTETDVDDVIQELEEMLEHEQTEDGE